MMPKKLKTIPSSFGFFVTSAILLGTVAQADLAIRFDEGAPKDRFSFENVGDCIITNAALTLDLEGSSAGLIFDVTSAGAGVEVFQPLELVSGGDALASLPQVADGDTAVVMQVARLEPGQTVAFTIDVDDTMGGREITVNEDEIVGASVELAAGDLTTMAIFETGPGAFIPLPACAQS